MSDTTLRAQLDWPKRPTDEELLEATFVPSILRKCGYSHSAEVVRRTLDEIARIRAQPGAQPKEQSGPEHSGPEAVAEEP